MTKPGQSFLLQAGSEPSLPRPRHGHRQAGTTPGDGDQRQQASTRVEIADPHPDWLKRWRSLRTDQGRDRRSGAGAESLRALQDKIAHTPASTLEGLQAQAELISELAWNDVVASTARQLIAGIRRLRKSEAGS